MLTTRTRMKVLAELAEEDGDASGTPTKFVAVETESNDTEAGEKRERRRKMVITELFETEKTYLKHLELAHKFFEFPLRFNCLISERAHSNLFSNLEQIKEVNTKLLEHMEQSTVGTAFKFLGPFLKLYSMYANNHQQALATLQENLQKNEKFARFMQTEEDRPEVMGLKLGALLITPVQRVPRYKLLLEDLLENTSPDHHDYLHLKEAAKQVGEIAVHINEHVRQHENFQRMLAIQNSFDSSAPKLLAPGREFIKEGKLNKVSRRGGKTQERMFFLFSDLLLYGKPKLLDSGRSSYSCCCVLPLRHCQVEKVLGSLQRSDGSGMFKITCKDESLLLSCVGSEEAKTWVEVLENTIRKLNFNRQTLRKPSSNKVPVRGKSLIRMRLRERKQDLKGAKSLIRIRLRERKQDLKNKVMPKKRTSMLSKDKPKLSPFKKSLRALSEVDLNNCLSPSKRRRTDTASTISSCDDYEQNNEISLDNWDPDQCSEDPDHHSQTGDDSPGPSRPTSDYDSTDRISSDSVSYDRASSDRVSSTIYEEDDNSCNADDGENESDSGAVYGSGSGSRSAGSGYGSGSSNRNSGSVDSEWSGPGSGSRSSCDKRVSFGGEQSQEEPHIWMNPNFQPNENGHCATWPIRRVLQGGSRVTSSIGSAMDSVRKERCAIM